MFVNNGMVRARSVFSEPAAYTVGLSLCFLLLLYNRIQAIKLFDHIVYLTGIVSANSVSGYAMAAAIYAFYFFRVRNPRLFKRTLLLLLPAAAAALFLATNGYVLGRVKNLFALKDRSGVVRTVGGFYFLKYTPFYGVGLGNQANYYHSLDSGVREMEWFSGSGEFYNILLVAVITMGYIGMAGFLLLLWQILRKDIRLFFSLLVVFMSTGRLFTPSIWVFLILYVAMAPDKHCQCVSKVEAGWWNNG